MGRFKVYKRTRAICGSSSPGQRIAQPQASSGPCLDDAVAGTAEASRRTGTARKRGGNAGCALRGMLANVPETVADARCRRRRPGRGVEASGERTWQRRDNNGDRYARLDSGTTTLDSLAAGRRVATRR
jgi:hypothetical protein